MDEQKALKLLRAHRYVLTSQQYKTIRGQILAGDPVGAVHGIRTIMKRREANGR